MKFQKGYKGYRNLFLLGDLEDLIQDDDFIQKKLKMFINNLDDNKTYTMLSIIRWMNEDSGNTEGIIMGQSLKITKFVNIKLLTMKLQHEVYSAITRYNFSWEINDCELLLMSSLREWLDLD